MKIFLAAIILFLGVALVLGAKPATSPNGKLSVKTSDGKLVISYEKQTVLDSGKSAPSTRCLPRSIASPDASAA